MYAILDAFINALICFRRAKKHSLSANVHLFSHCLRIRMSPCSPWPSLKACVRGHAYFKMYCAISTILCVSLRSNGFDTERGLFHLPEIGYLLFTYHKPERELYGNRLFFLFDWRENVTKRTEINKNYYYYLSLENHLGKYSYEYK